MSTTTPPAAPLPQDLEALLRHKARRLRMPHTRAADPDVLATARSQRREPAEVLRALFTAEVAGRDRSALATRRARAAFPTGKTFQAWKPDASSIPAPTQQALRTLECLHRKENLVLCGPSGTGKTFFLEALGQLAVAKGRHVSWFTLEDLGGLIRRHRADDTVAAQTRPPSARQQRDEQLIPQLLALWRDNYRVYGARKLWKAARRVGHDIGRGQVARLRRAAGIQSVRRGRQVRTTRPDLAAPRHPDLVKAARRSQRS